MILQLMTKAGETIELTARTVVKQLRRRLGVTQEGLGQALGISTKAVQSYEQGWRETPPRVVKQLLSLVAMNQENYAASKPCWEVRACSSEHRQTCPAKTITHGRFCWAVALKVCAKARGDTDVSVLGCLDCDVVRQIL